MHNKNFQPDKLRDYCDNAALNIAVKCEIVIRQQRAHPLSHQSVACRYPNVPDAIPTEMKRNIDALAAAQWRSACSLAAFGMDSLTSQYVV
jgi:hypothetical protein